MSKGSSDHQVNSDIGFETYYAEGIRENQSLCIPSDYAGQQEQCYMAVPFVHKVVAGSDDDGLLDIPPREGSQNSFTELEFNNLVAQISNAQQKDSILFILWKGKTEENKELTGRLVVLGKLSNESGRPKFELTSINGLMLDFPLEDLEGGIDLATQFGADPLDGNIATHSLIITINEWAQAVIDKAFETCSNSKNNVELPSKE